MGHVYQSYALSTALRDVADARITFLVPDYPDGLNKFRGWGVDIVEIPSKLSCEEKASFLEERISSRQVDLIISDILGSSQALMAYFRRKGRLLVSIDDIGDGRVYADLLFNVIHHPTRPLGARYTELSDLRYVIIRDEFRQFHAQAKEISERVNRLLVSQGGSDTFGGIIEMAKAMDSIPPDVEIVLLAGAAFRHEAELEVALKGTPRQFTVLKDVREMAKLMYTCDLAITGAGKTVFELAVVGVPFIIATEEPRELETAEIVAQHVLCENLGLRAHAGSRKIAQAVGQLIMDRDRRKAMSCSGKMAVDGAGAQRVALRIVQELQQR